MITCKICVMKYGFKLSDTDRIFKSNEELYEHMENVHGQVVMREGETADQAIARCAKKGIVSDRSICKCSDCVKLRKDKR